MKTLLLMLHSVMGIVMMGMLLWMLAGLRCDNPPYQMLKRLSVAVALLALGVWGIAGYWYVVYYTVEKIQILHGTMPWAHRVVMEIKEHLFLAVAIVALYLPVAVISEGTEGAQDRQGRSLIRTVAWMLLLLLFVIEGAGAIVAQGVKHGCATAAHIERGNWHETTL